MFTRTSYAVKSGDRQMIFNLFRNNDYKETFKGREDDTVVRIESNEYEKMEKAVHDMQVLRDGLKEQLTSIDTEEDLDPDDTGTEN
ncbi:MAG: hypothetical protein AABY32_00855 [Nanoarchaeota archaeon]